MGQEPAGKGKWEKPALVVLVRGRPEEAILTTCKSGTVIPPFGEATNSNVACIDHASSPCTACSADAPS